ncbi:type VI immunity family protein [Corallococcus sp. RDP092CA]|uniref:type VI immunity family protein n=1 Tax=Corallococcus sp. RDP092CA TaxID=3109369 RepID=UPI0035AE1F1C
MSNYPSYEHFATSLPRVQLVMRVVFYLPHDHSVLAPLLQRALDAYLEFIQRSGGALTTGEDPDISEATFPLTPEYWEEAQRHLTKPRFEDLEDLQEDSYWFRQLTKRGFDTWVLLRGGLSEPDGYQFSFESRLPWKKPLGYSILDVQVPMRFLDEQGPGKAHELARSLAEFLPFSTGHAGLSLSFTRGRAMLLPLLKNLLLRHPGWEVPRESTSSMGDGIDGIHWLNFLGSSILATVGGPKEIRAHLHHPGTTIEAFTGDRALISLGPAPLAGDTKLGETLPAYRELARFLEPWLLPFAPSDTWDGYTEEETRRWWRRFLEAPPEKIHDPRDG